MSNILDKIAQIRDAVFGSDVRENIASGIEAINTEVESTTAKQNELEEVFNELVINAGNSNAEIVVARGGEVDLPTRLNKVDSSLAESPKYPQLVSEVGVVDKQYDYGNISRYKNGDDTQAMQNALISIVNMYNSTGELKRLFFPAGTYTIDSSTINFSLTMLNYTSPLVPKLELCGDGMATIIVNSDIGFIFDRALVDVHDLTFTTNNVENTKVAIQVGGKNNDALGNAVFQSSFKRLRFYYFNVGIDLGNCFDSEFEDITLWYGKGITSNAIRFANCIKNCQLNNLTFTRIHSEYCGYDSVAIRIDEPVDNSGNVTNYHKNLMFNSLHIETRTYKCTAVSLKRVINVQFNNLYIIQNYDIVSQAYSDLKYMFIFDSCSNIQINCATLRAGTSTQVSSIANYSLFKLLNACHNITINNSELYVPLTVRHIYDIVDKSTAEILANVSIITFNNSFINELKYPLGQSPIVFTNDSTGSTNSKFVFDKRNVGALVSLDFGSLTGDTDIKDSTKKHSVNHDGTLSPYALTNNGQITVANATSGYYYFYNDNYNKGFRFVSIKTATQDYFALLYVTGTTVISIAKSDAVSINTSGTPSGYIHIAMSSGQLRFVNNVGEDITVNVVPLMFAPNS